MTSNSISLKNSIARIEPAWRWAIGVYLGARLFYSLWSVVVMLLAPTVTQNLNLFGVPLLAYFDVATGERYVYARTVNGQTLTFRANDAGTMRDAETDSVWSLRAARAVQGKFAGAQLQPAMYTTEEVFPYRGVNAEKNPLLGVWQRFDTNWFLKLAQRGYAGDDGSTVYMPLYPLLIRVSGTILLGNDLFAAIFISNIALVVSLYLLFRLTEELFDVSSAKRVLLYAVIFPTAFFWFAAYTEALFFLCALASLFFARKGHWWWAGVLGALAAFTRLQGVLMLVPLVYMVWAQVAGRKLQVTPHVLRAGLPLLLIPLATLSFLWFSNLSLLQSYEGELHARFVLPWENVWAAVALMLQGRAGLVDYGNLIVTLLFGAMLIPVWRMLPRAYALYALVMFLAPLFRMTTTQPLVSMLRYVLVLFPVFMVWAVWGKNVWVNRAVVYVSFPLSLYFSAQFWLWGWVA